MFVADLEPIAMLRAHVPVLAIGWLERGKAFSSGAIGAATYRRLIEFQRDRWLPFASAGSHRCDLCQFDRDASGTQMLFIPSQAKIYCCPDLITHYINAHGYLPPQEFCDAVDRCPDMRSMEFKRQLVAHGVKVNG